MRRARFTHRRRWRLGSLGLGLLLAVGLAPSPARAQQDPLAAALDAIEVAAQAIESGDEDATAVLNQAYRIGALVSQLPVLTPGASPTVTDLETQLSEDAAQLLADAYNQDLDATSNDADGLLGTVASLREALDLPAR